MATEFQAAQAGDGFPSITPDGANDVTPIYGEYEISAALVINDTIDLVKLPAQCVGLDFTLMSDDLDTAGPTIVLKVDVYDSVLDAIAATVIAANTVAQAGGVARMDTVQMPQLAPVDYDRYLRVTVSTAPTTGATTGTIAGVLLLRGANQLDR